MLPLSICVPTLCCADLLQQSLPGLIQQLSLGDVIHILDNGNQSLEKMAESFSDKVQLLRSERNLGVAGSWNKLIEISFPRFPWVLMLNDDIELGPSQLAAIRKVLAAADGQWMLTGPYYWSVFAISQACVKNIGRFDDNFFPAYFEDNDFHRRINLVDPDKYTGNVAEMEPAVKRNSETIRRVPGIHRFVENRRYYDQKWGGGPGAETFSRPFSGSGEPIEDAALT